MAADGHSQENVEAGATDVVGSSTTKRVEDDMENTRDFFDEEQDEERMENVNKMDIFPAPAAAVTELPQRPTDAQDGDEDGDTESPMKLQNKTGEVAAGMPTDEDVAERGRSWSTAAAEEAE